MPSTIHDNLGKQFLKGILIGEVKKLNTGKIDEFAEKVRQDTQNPSEHKVLKPPPIGEIYKESQSKKEGVDEFAEKVREETRIIEEKEFEATKESELGKAVLDLSNS